MIVWILRCYNNDYQERYKFEKTECKDIKSVNTKILKTWMQKWYKV